MATKTIYRIVFRNQDEIFEIHAREVSQSNMLGFIEAQGLLFGERSSIVVDPTEEKLRLEFAGSNRTYIPIQAIIRIDEVKKRGANRIRKVSGSSDNVTPLPTALLTPKK